MTLQLTHVIKVFVKRSVSFLRCVHQPHLQTVSYHCLRAGCLKHSHDQDNRCDNTYGLKWWPKLSPSSSSSSSSSQALALQAKGVMAAHFGMCIASCTLGHCVTLGLRPVHSLGSCSSHMSVYVSLTLLCCLHPYVSMLSLFHAVHIECPDTVLIERYGGKRVDSLTGGSAILHRL